MSNGAVVRDVSCFCKRQPLNPTTFPANMVHCLPLNPPAPGFSEGSMSLLVVGPQNTNMCTHTRAPTWEAFPRSNSPLACVTIESSEMNGAPQGRHSPTHSSCFRPPYGTVRAAEPLAPDFSEWSMSLLACAPTPNLPCIRVPPREFSNSNGY